MNQKRKNIVIGASGLIGGALYQCFQKNGESVIGTYSQNCILPDMIRLDITEGNFQQLVALINPEDNVYILSAYSNPSWIYNNPEEAEKLNLIGTIGLIDALREKNPRIIFMSSVEVFDGTRKSYREFDVPYPLNLYGELKFKIEEFLKLTYKKSTIVRTGWNVGLDKRSRCVVRLTYDTLLKPNARMAIDNQFSISSVIDTANALRELAHHPALNEIHIAADDVVSRVDLAKIICEHSRRGAEMNFEECLFSDIKYSEPRARLNYIDNSLSKEILLIKYQDAKRIITDKISFIDNLESL